MVISWAEAILGFRGASLQIPEVLYERYRALASDRECETDSKKCPRCHSHCEQPRHHKLQFLRHKKLF